MVCKSKRRIILSKPCAQNAVQMSIPSCHEGTDTAKIGNHVKFEAMNMFFSNFKTV